jgi:porin
MVMYARPTVLSTVIIASFALSTGTIGQESPPAQTTRPGFFEREELTGDWGGVRSKWKAKGFEFASSVTQYYQGVVKGGAREASEYNGTAAVEFTFDFGKLWDWSNWLLEVKADARFGDPLLTGTGSINPVNTAAIIPTAEGDEVAITAFNLTKLVPINLEEGKLFAISIGRFNLVDLLDEDFFAGAGIERFMNIAQIGPLTVLRQVPLVTNAVSLAYITGGQPFITFAVMDPNDHSMDSGLSDLFADGVTFAPGIYLPSKWFGKSGKHSFSGAITTKEYTPFDAIRQIILPGPPLNPVEPEPGSWSIGYALRQYIVERAARDGWGVFAQVSFADANTSPITTFFDVGLGGNGLFSNRPRDEFGIAIAYTDLSSELKDNLDLRPLGRRRLRAEQQVEVFYNLHLAPWLQLTGDLQVIRPVRPLLETAVVPAVRLRIVF